MRSPTLNSLQPLDNDLSMSVCCLLSTVFHREGTIKSNVVCNDLPKNSMAGERNVVELWSVIL